MRIVVFREPSRPLVGVQAAGRTDQGLCGHGEDLHSSAGLQEEESTGPGTDQAWDFPFPFVERLVARLQPMGNQRAILDLDLAPFLGLSLPRLRATITHNLKRLPQGEVFRHKIGLRAVWAMTEFGALIVTSWVPTPEASAAHVRLIRSLHRGKTSQ